MRKLVTALALLAAAVWSALVWGGYALIGWTGDFVAQNAGTLALPAEAVEVANWAQVLAATFGQGAAVVLWLLGIGLIGIVLLAANLILGRLAPAPRALQGFAPQPLPQAGPPVQPQPAPAPPVASAPMWGRNASGR